MLITGIKALISLELSVGLWRSSGWSEVATQVAASRFRLRSVGAETISKPDRCAARREDI